MAAVSVILLFLGSVIWVFAYVAPIATGMIIFVIKRAFDNHIALITYISISVLSLFLLPDKECALMYALFFGYYPIIKSSIDKINSFILRIILKLFVFNASLAIIELLCVYVLNIPFDDFLGKWGIVILVVSFNIVFLLYDRLFIAASIIYDRKLSKYLK